MITHPSDHLGGVFLAPGSCFGPHSIGFIFLRLLQQASSLCIVRLVGVDVVLFFRVGELRLSVSAGIAEVWLACARLSCCI